MGTKGRKQLLVANWKMHGKPSGALALASELTDGFDIADTELVICAPYTHLDRLQVLKTKGIGIGAQNCHFADKGAFTGEIAALMLADLGCDYVLIGHSERRTLDTPESIPLRIEQALKVGLQVIYCCGEPKSSRESGQQWDYVSNQMNHDLSKLEPLQLQKIVIAYEPIWAIGTGLTASPEQAQEMHKNIRNWIELKYGILEAIQLLILYGGSVKAINAKALATMPDIDGVLVGGASLIPNEFRPIIQGFS